MAVNAYSLKVYIKHISFYVNAQAAYGLSGNKDDKDYVRDYFTIEQDTYVSSGVTKRLIDISSPYSHGLLYEDTTITGMARINEVFLMENLPADLKAATSWWGNLFTK